MLWCLHPLTNISSYEARTSSNLRKELELTIMLLLNASAVVVQAFGALGIFMDSSFLYVEDRAKKRCN